MTTRFLYFDWFSSATEFYRMLPLDYIVHPNFTITRSTERNITFATISAYDVIIIERPSTEASLSLMKLAKDCGKKIIADFDDDCLHLPNDIHPMHGVYEAEKENVISCLAIADEVWVATEGIKKAYRLYNKNIHVIPNSHNDVLFPVADKRPFTYNKTAMWRGGGSHLGDIYAPGTAEWLVKLINGNRKWKFYFLGQRFEWLEMRVKHGNYYRHGGASTVQFYKLMHEYNASVFFYPLANNLFNQSKSNCSFLEATYSGSAYYGNKDLHEFNLDCILSLNLLDEALKVGFGSEHFREYNIMAWEHIQDTLLVSKTNIKRIERLENFIK